MSFAKRQPDLLHLPYKPHTLSSRLALWYGASMVAFLFIALLTLLLLIGQLQDKRLDADLREDIEEFQALYVEHGINRVKSEIAREAQSNDNEKEFLRLLNHRGESLFQSNLKHWKGLKTNLQALDHLESHPREVVLETLSLPRQDYATRVVYGRLDASLYLQVGESYEENMEVMALLSWVFAVLFLIVTPVVVWIIGRIARHVSGDLERITQSVGAMERNTLQQRIALKSPYFEIAALIDSFNAMTERVQCLVNEMREMTDNIAHDLRSPLARIRAIAESTLSLKVNTEPCKTAAADILEECDRLIKMINTTLDVAEAEAGVAHAPRTVVDVSQLVSEVYELYEPLADQKGVIFKLQAPTGIMTRGNAQQLQRTIANLLDNALKYTSSSGTVCINVQQRQSTIEVTVTDSGCGIRQEDLQRIFERFYRCDPSRAIEGCGLGLSFARAVVRAHGGEIIVKSQAGEGSTFIINLPAIAESELPER